MSRGRRYIDFDGLFEHSVLGTFSIIRGFALLQDLAEISCAYEMSDGGQSPEVIGHQRKIDDKRVRAIASFLEKGDNRFLPEVILSVRTIFTPEMIGQEQVGVSTNGNDGIYIRRRFTSRNLRIHSITIDVASLKDILGSRLIRRVDGNHRLAAATTLANDPSFPKKYLAPFCLVLLGPVGRSEDDYAESLMFHTLNSKAVPLDSEHALKLILGQNSTHTMTPSKEFAYSPELHLTRLLMNGVQSLPKPARQRFGVRPLTCLSAAAESMIRADVKIVTDHFTLKLFSDELVAAMSDIVARLFPMNKDLCQEPYFIDIVSKIWKQATGNNHDDKVQTAITKLAGLAHWLRQNNLLDMIGRASPSDQLLKIYDSIQLSIPKRIFLARWYPDPDTDGPSVKKAKLRLDQIEQTLKDLKNDKGIKLELIDMGTKKGGTYLIHPKMYEAIKSSDIILIDLTGLRPNVCIEAGYALQHHEKGRLLFLFQPYDTITKVPFDLTTFRYEPISEAAEIPEKIKPHIEEIMKTAAGT